MKPSQLSNTLRRIASAIDSSDQPSKSKVASELRRVVASFTTDIKSVEEALYGHSGGETDPDMQSSSIWWQVFDKLGMEDWTPLTDYPSIESEARRLLNEWSEKWNPEFSSGEKKALIEESIKELKQNWETYQKHYMPEHIQILSEKGLWPFDQ